MPENSTEHVERARAAFEGILNQLSSGGALGVAEDTARELTKDAYAAVAAFAGLLPAPARTAKQRKQAGEIAAICDRILEQITERKTTVSDEESSARRARMVRLCGEMRRYLEERDAAADEGSAPDVESVEHSPEPRPEPPAPSSAEQRRERRRAVALLRRDADQFADACAERPDELLIRAWLAYQPVEYRAQIVLEAHRRSVLPMD